MRASGGLIPEKPNYLLITSDVTYGYDADLGTYCLFSTALDSTGRIVDLKTEISGVRPRTGRLYTYITDTSGLTELTAFSYENASSMGGFRFDGIISSDDNSIITASAGKEYRITDSTRIWNLDNGTPVSSEKLEKAEELITGQLYRQNILMLTDPANEGEITDIFVEITGADIHYLVEMPERDHSDMLEWAEDPFEGSILTGDGRKVKLHFIRRTAGKLYLSVKNSEGELVYAGSRTADGENRSDALEWSGVNMTAWPFWTGMDDLNMMGSSKLKWEKEQISLGQNLEDIGSCSYTVILVDEYGIAHSITTGFVS